jgi:hypothetical protein
MNRNIKNETESRRDSSMRSPEVDSLKQLLEPIERDLDNLRQLLEHLWTERSMLYSAMREVTIARRKVELVRVRLSGGEV